MSWNYESIKEKRRNQLYNELGKDIDNHSSDLVAKLIDRLLSVEAALYPFVYVCGSLDEKSDGGTTATSKLFPMLTEIGENFQIYERSDSGTEGKWVEKKEIDEDKLHDVIYLETDSIRIEDGSKLHDHFQILAVHQQAPCAYIGCGSITMGDVRHAMNVLWPKPDTESTD